MPVVVVDVPGGGAGATWRRQASRYSSGWTRKCATWFEVSKCRVETWMPRAARASMSASSAGTSQMGSASEYMYSCLAEHGDAVTRSQ